MDGRTVMLNVRVPIHICVADITALIAAEFGVCLSCGELHNGIAESAAPYRCIECGGRTVVDLVRAIEFGAVHVEGKLAA
jgi:hypothetical protein